jgi:hypothetical protein
MSFRLLSVVANMNLERMINNRPFQRFSSVAAFTIGAGGIFAGAVLLGSRDPIALGILPAAGLLMIGCLGLRELAKRTNSGD